jgi:hypothetical protein
MLFANEMSHIGAFDFKKAGLPLAESFHGWFLILIYCLASASTKVRILKTNNPRARSELIDHQYMQRASTLCSLFISDSRVFGHASICHRIFMQSIWKNASWRTAECLPQILMKVASL